MKVVSKFALAFFAAACVCLAVFTYVLAEREVGRVERLVTQGLTSFATGMRPAIESAWRDRGFEAAQRIVADFPPDGVLRVTIAETANPPPTVTSHIRALPTGGHMVHVTMPVTGPAGRTAVLELARTVADDSTVFRADIREQLLTAAALALVMGIIAAVLGAWVIGGPLGRMVAQARRIGAGDFSQRLKSTGTDEIGVLKRELNAMCDRLVDAQARLEEEAAARVETLEQLRHLDRLRTVGTIASSIAHELGTPLNVLLLRGQSLASGEVAAVEVEDAGRAVLAQVEKMSRIVRQLLGFTRSRSASTANATELDPLAVCRHACGLLGSLAKKHHVSIDVQGDTAARTRGDFGQLEQALTNLIVNGIQAMPNGGKLTIRVTAPPDDDAVAIAVSDEGDGMPPDVISRIFEPFFTTKPGAEGTGLGLNVARGIAEDHGGSIGVTSQPGAGTTFTMRLPRIA